MPSFDPLLSGFLPTMTGAAADALASLAPAQQAGKRQALQDFMMMRQAQMPPVHAAHWGFLQYDPKTQQWTPTFHPTPQHAGDPLKMAEATILGNPQLLQQYGQWLEDPNKGPMIRGLLRGIQQEQNYTDRLAFEKSKRDLDIEKKVNETAALLDRIEKTTASLVQATREKGQASADVTRQKGQAAADVIKLNGQARVDAIKALAEEKQIQMRETGKVQREIMKDKAEQAVADMALIAATKNELIRTAARDPIKAGTAKRLDMVERWMEQHPESTLDELPPALKQVWDAVYKQPGLFGWYQIGGGIYRRDTGEVTKEAGFPTEPGFLEKFKSLFPGQPAPVPPPPASSTGSPSKTPSAPAVPNRPSAPSPSSQMKVPDQELESAKQFYLTVGKDKAQAALSDPQSGMTPTQREALRRFVEAMEGE